MMGYLELPLCRYQDCQLHPATLQKHSLWQILSLQDYPSVSVSGRFNVDGVMYESDERW